MAEALPAPKIGLQDGRRFRIVEACLPSSLRWAAACERRRRTSDTSSAGPNGFSSRGPGWSPPRHCRPQGPRIPPPEGTGQQSAALYADPRPPRFLSYEAACGAWPTATARKEHLLWEVARGRASHGGPTRYGLAARAARSRRARRLTGAVPLVRHRTARAHEGPHGWSRPASGTAV